MMRISIFFILFIMLLATSGPALSQGIPACYPTRLPAFSQCGPSRPVPPITRTVQVDVPVPCPPPTGCLPAAACAPHPCGPPMPCPPSPCAPPVCAPPQCPTKPVQVRVDVVVRPETPKPCVPQTFCCENPPVFEPIFYQAAGLVQSLIAAPLALGEIFMAHPVPMPMPVPSPIPCWRPPAAMRPPCFQPPPATQCMAPSPLPVRCALPGPPAKVKAPPVCGPAPAWTQRPNSPFPR
jgi:hypothetical protein